MDKTPSWSTVHRSMRKVCKPVRQTKRKAITPAKKKERKAWCVQMLAALSRSEGAPRRRSSKTPEINHEFLAWTDESMVRSEGTLLTERAHLDPEGDIEACCCCTTRPEG